MEKLAIIILAAGKGSRMGGELPKVLLETLNGKLITNVLKTALKLDPEETIVVTGYKSELVKEELKNYKIKFAEQKELLGTGHAVLSTIDLLKDYQGKVLILYGDVPLISEKTLKEFINNFDKNNLTLSVISFNPPDNNHKYGRILKNNGEFIAIKEHVDCSIEEKQINECNSGIYLVDSSFLIPAVKELKNDNNQKEYYLTDIVARAVKEGQNTNAFLVDNYVEILGVNTPFELNQINQELRKIKIKELILNGVNFENPSSCIIDPEVEIKQNVTIGSSVSIKGKTTIGSDTIIENGCLIINSEIGNNCHIKLSTRIESAVVGNFSAVGPMANLREKTVLGEHVKIGNFVETKKSILSNNVKASHLTYLGDCEVGENTNIGAGTITCNYDGKNKFKTKIGKNAFIGSNSSLVAPVEIGDNSLIAAGSTITKNVSDNSLGIARAKQEEKKGYRK